MTGSRCEENLYWRDDTRIGVTRRNVIVVSPLSSGGLHK